MNSICTIIATVDKDDHTITWEVSTQGESGRIFSTLTRHEVRGNSRSFLMFQDNESLAGCRIKPATKKRTQAFHDGVLEQRSLIEHAVERISALNFEQPPNLNLPTGTEEKE